VTDLEKKSGVTAAKCTYCDDCKCKPGVCPACPTATYATRVVIGGVPHVQGEDGVFRAAPGHAPLQLGAPCIGGTCGAQAFFGGGGSCSGGSCGAPAFFGGGSCSGGSCGGSRGRR
jgi:hypothetical protein